MRTNRISERIQRSDHIHTITKLIEVSREYKLPLCLTFNDLKKAFDSVETEAHISVLRELYSGFATKISPFYNDVDIDDTAAFYVSTDNYLASFEKEAAVATRMHSVVNENVEEWEDGTDMIYYKMKAILN
ncbi:unnamed protein product [Heligmosomoides polygyrus]|uniref:Reverse transcriptase domain-containing protein n=1 Tax=Heligmosomoides polygyrus TaxID=6339 RepID=A0A3P7Y7J6_HELPZ|nr:unnamed protein product [Heligmosomoides polygyrus]